MKRNIAVLFMLLLAVCSITSCDNSFNEEIEFSHPVMLHTNTIININENISFSDLSQGVVTRKWSFPEGVVDVIKSDNDLESGEKIVHATFKKSGKYEVRFTNELKNASFNMDSIIPITVLDTIISKIWNEAPIVNGVHTIEAGSEIRFSSLSTGEPDTFDWAFEGATPEMATDSTLLVKFKKLGTWDVALIASRDRPWGIDTLQLKDHIKVIPSTKPVTLDQVSQTDDNKMGLFFSRELQLPVNQLANFSATNNGTLVNILSVKQDPADATILYIEVEGDVINIDAATISYTPGDLISTDFVTVDGFTDIQVTPRFVNLLGVNPDLEDGTLDGWNLARDWQAPTGEGTITDEEAHSGMYSVKVVHTGDNYNVAAGGDALIQDGKMYRLEFWFKAAPGSTLDWHNYELGYNTSWENRGGGWFYGPDEWTKVTTDVDSGSWGTDWVDGRLKVQVRQQGTFYLDDFAIYELQSR